MEYVKLTKEIEVGVWRVCDTAGEEYSFDVTCDSDGDLTITIDEPINLISVRDWIDTGDNLTDLMYESCYAGRLGALAAVLKSFEGETEKHLQEIKDVIDGFTSNVSKDA